jgi:hypothetical protein
MLSPDEGSFDGSDFGSYLSDDDSGERSGTLWDPYGYAEAAPDVHAPVVKLSLPPGLMGASSGLVGVGNAADLEGEGLAANTAAVVKATAGPLRPGTLLVSTSDPKAKGPLAGKAGGVRHASGVASEAFAGSGSGSGSGFVRVPGPSAPAVALAAATGPEASSAGLGTSQHPSGSLPAASAPSPGSPWDGGTGASAGCEFGFGSPLHARVLACLLHLLVAPHGGFLSPALCPIFPLQGSKAHPGTCEERAATGFPLQAPGTPPLSVHMPILSAHMPRPLQGVVVAPMWQGSRTLPHHPACPLAPMWSPSVVPQVVSWTPVPPLCCRVTCQGVSYTGPGPQLARHHSCSG